MRGKAGRPKVLVDAQEVRLSLPAKDMARLLKISQARGVSMSHILRELVARYLAEQGEEAQHGEVSGSG